MKNSTFRLEEIALVIIFCAAFAGSFYVAGLIQIKAIEIAYIISSGVAIFIAADVGSDQPRNPYLRALLFGYGTPFFIGAIGRSAATYATLTA
jgi:hypothetical protein